MKDRAYFEGCKQRALEMMNSRIEEIEAQTKKDIEEIEARAKQRIADEKAETEHYIKMTDKRCKQYEERKRLQVPFRFKDFLFKEEDPFDICAHVGKIKLVIEEDDLGFYVQYWPTEGVPWGHKTLEKDRRTKKYTTSQSNMRSFREYFDDMEEAINEGIKHARYVRFERTF